LIRDLRNKIITQALLALSQVAFPLVTYPVITKALGAEGLGKVNFADSIVQTLLIIASLGIPLYGIREIALVKNNKEEQSKIGSELFSLQVLSSLPAAVCIWILGLLSEVDHDLLWTGTIALISSCLTSEWFFHGNQQFHYIAYRTIFTRTLTTVLIYFLINDPGDYVLYYMLLSGNVVLTFLMNFTRISKSIKLTTRHIDPWRHIKKINWIFACYIFAAFYTVLDSLMLGWMSTHEAVGRYSFGYKLIRMSAMLIPTLGLVFIPRIASNHAEENRQGVEDQIRISQQLIFLSAFRSVLFFLFWLLKSLLFLQRAILMKLSW
jgi:O-antigen/teichoic acid export membrane protein